MSPSRSTNQRIRGSGVRPRPVDPVARRSDRARDADGRRRRRGVCCGFNHGYSSSRPGGGLLEISLQRVEPFLPERLVVRDPVGGRAHGPGHEPAVVHAALAPPCEQARALEHPEVPRDRRRGHGERPRELADRCVRRLHQSRQDRPPRRVGERVEGGVGAAARIVNHMVNYIAARRRCRETSPARIGEALAGRYSNPNVLTRNTAICSRVFGVAGSSVAGRLTTAGDLARRGPRSRRRRSSRRHVGEESPSAPAERSRVQQGLQQEDRHLRACDGVAGQ